MMKLLGLIVMLLSIYSLDQEFSFSMVQSLAIGVLMYFSEAILGHFFFVQREKVRAEYRLRK